MSQFSYSFCVSLFHSLWQSALLLALYATMTPIIKKQLPSLKRNILFGLLFTQVVISATTFFIYYSDSFNFYRDIIESKFSVFTVKQSLVEKFAPWIIAFYTSFISFKTMHLIYNWHRFKHLCNSTLVKPCVDLKLFTLKKANEFGIHRKVTLWFSSTVTTPLTFGFLKPVILMPVALFNHLSIKEAESLIIHELTHIKNNDYILNWLLVIAETLFFFNPFVKIICNKIKLEREKNCDVQVLQYQYSVVKYAETLLKTAKFKTNINFFPLAAVFKNKALLQRIRFFTVDNNLQFSKRNYSTISFSAIIMALFINLFILTQIRNYHGIAKSGITVPKIIQQDENNSIPAFADEVSPVIAASAAVSTKNMDEQIATINRQVKKINVAVKIMNERESEINTENLNVNYAIPAANVQTEEKEMIVKEEVSGTTEAVTRAYKMKLKNGQWKDELMYIIKEGRPQNDSICNSKDSIECYIPAMQ